MARNPIPPNLERRIEYDTNGGCWLWTGCLIGSMGYGTMRLDGKHKAAHRYSWELANGTIPEGLVVRHRCDVASCVNPHHLELGTQLDNVRDRDKRGRQRARRGASHPCTPFSVEEVIAIRKWARRGASQKAIALHYGVAQFSVNNLCLGKTWASVKEGILAPGDAGKWPRDPRATAQAIAELDALRGAA